MAYGKAEQEKGRLGRGKLSKVHLEVFEAKIVDGGAAASIFANKSRFTLNRLVSFCFTSQLISKDNARQ